MADSNFINEIKARRTFSIIAYPDAGKTTIIEKLLWLGQLIQVVGLAVLVAAVRAAPSRVTPWCSPRCW